MRGTRLFEAMRLRRLEDWKYLVQLHKEEKKQNEKKDTFADWKEGSLAYGKKPESHGSKKTYTSGSRLFEAESSRKLPDWEKVNKIIENRNNKPNTFANWKDTSIAFGKKAQYKKSNDDDLER